MRVLSPALRPRISCPSRAKGETLETAKSLAAEMMTAPEAEVAIGTTIVDAIMTVATMTAVTMTAGTGTMIGMKPVGTSPPRRALGCC